MCLCVSDADNGTVFLANDIRTHAEKIQKHSSHDIVYIAQRPCDATIVIRIF